MTTDESRTRGKHSHTERDATQETFQWESYTIGLSLAELNYTESFFRTLNRGCISFQELRDSGPAG